MTTLFTSFLVLCLTALLTAFSSLVYATSVQHVQPQGMIDSGRQILVRFDGDMQALGRDDAAAPVTIRCSASIPFPASGRWVNSREWAMTMPQTLAAGTQCQITLVEGLKDLAGSPVRADARAWSFNTGSVRILRTWPSTHNEISEQQTFLLSLNAAVSAAGLKQFLTCQTRNGSPSAIEILDEAGFRSAWRKYFSATEVPSPSFAISKTSPGSRPNVAVRCSEPAPPDSDVRLVLQRGLALNNVVHATDQVLPYRVQSAFTAALTCQIQTGVEGCDFRQSIRLRLSAWVTPTSLPSLRLSDGSVIPATWNSRGWRPGQTTEFSFEGPFKSIGTATLSLPAGLTDEEGRALANAAEFPKRFQIADAPAYLGMVQSQGTISAKQGQSYWPIAVRKLEAEIPVQVRRLNHEHAQAPHLAAWLTALARDNAGAQFSQESLKRVDDEFQRVLAPAFSSRNLNVRTAQSDMEFVPVPLTEPGVYVIDADSARYQAHQAAVLKAREDTRVSLWGRRAIVQVTNLNAGIRIAQHGDSLIWVTALDSGQPVADATLSLLDCSGTPLWQGRSDSQGLAWIRTALSSKRCEQSAIALPVASPRDRWYTDSGLTLVAQKDKDLVAVPARAQSPEQVVMGAGHLAHVVLDRSLFKAAEIVSMQVHFRWINSHGLALATSSQRALTDLVATVRDPAGQELAKLPLKLNDQGDATLSWTLPVTAKLGQYRVQLAARTGTNSFNVASASFQVEEFRTPVFDAKLEASTAWSTPVAPPTLPNSRQQLHLNASLRYLSGGAAAKEKVVLRGVYQAGVQAPVPGFDFNGAVKAPAPPPLSDSGVLDAQGKWRRTLLLPSVTAASTLNLEMQFNDPNGEVQTVASATGVWPHETRPGLRLHGPKDGSSPALVEAVLLDASNQPVVGRLVSLKSTVRPYSPSDASEPASTVTTSVCETRTNAQGRVLCPLKLQAKDRNERLLISLTAPDRVDANTAKPMEFIHESSTYSLRWQRPQNELNFVETAPFQQGQKLRLLAEPGRFPAVALVSVEREGVLSAQVHQIQQAGELLELTLAEHFAPNVRVQVRYVMPQLADSQPVGLERSRMIKVDPGNLRLNISVSPTQTQARIRSQLPVAVRVFDSRSGAPAPNTRLTVAVVDEGLLALRPNNTWSLSDAMLRDRSILVSGYWLDRHLATRVPIGPKPNHLPPEELRAQRNAAPKAMAAAPAPAPSAAGARRAQESGAGSGLTENPAQAPARSEFSSLLVWRTDLTTDSKGEAHFNVPTNDSLSRFRIVVLGSLGANQFGEGTANFETSQALQVISGLPQQVRADDRIVQSLTLRNTSNEAITLHVNAKAEQFPTPLRALNADARRARGLDFEQDVRLAAGENKVIAWPLHVPSLPGKLNWTLQARAGQGNDALSDAVSVTQIVNEAVPVTTRQATLVQIEKEARLPYEQPSRALPQAGGVAITLQRSLVSAALAETIDWMRRYPYSCLEQQTSRYSTLDDQLAWEQLMHKLPQYLSSNGLANYFPVVGTGGNGSGSESLTAYVLDMAQAKGWQIPVTERSRMLDGLLAVQAGRLDSLDWAPSRYLLERQLSAQATLALYDYKRSEQRPVTPQDLSSLPSMALIDWIRYLLSPNSMPADKAALLAKAENELRSRFDFQGSRLRWRNERAEYWWWFMWSGDSVAARVASVAQQLAVISPAWRNDAPRIINGLISRQGSGRWSTTVANAWAAHALRQFAQTRESIPIAGITRANLSVGSTRPESQSLTLAYLWKAPDPTTSATQADRHIPELILPWPQQGAKGQIHLTHEGTGAPWATVAIKAAVRTVAPVAAGLGIRRVVTAVERKVPHQWHVGDVIRVRLEMSSDANNTWVVVRDAIPSGATILGRGLGRESVLAQQGERSLGWTWPSYVERATESYRAYYRWVPQGQWSTEYTLRLNNAGEFQLPAARIEAMYAPEIFGEVPAAGLVVKP